MLPQQEMKNYPIDTCDAFLYFHEEQSSGKSVEESINFEYMKKRPLEGTSKVQQAFTTFTHTPDTFTC